MEDPKIRIAGIVGLSGLKHPSARALILSALKDKDPRVSKAAASALVEDQDPEFASSLIKHILFDSPTTTDPALEQMLVNHLPFLTTLIQGRCKDSEGMPQRKLEQLLLARLPLAYPKVQMVLIQALGEIGFVPSIHVLVGIFRSGDNLLSESVRAALVQVLARLKRYELCPRCGSWRYMEGDRSGWNCHGEGCGLSNSGRGHPYWGQEQITEALEALLSGNPKGVKLYSIWKNGSLDLPD